MRKADKRIALKKSLSKQLKGIFGIICGERGIRIVPTFN